MQVQPLEPPLRTLPVESMIVALELTLVGAAYIAISIISCSDSPAFSEASWCPLCIKGAQKRTKVNKNLKYISLSLKNTYPLQIIQNSTLDEGIYLNET